MACVLSGPPFFIERCKMNPDKLNPLYAFLNLLGQLILLSICYVVCCLPVITVGGATAALYYTVVKVLRRGQDSLFGAFFRELRGNFLQGLRINLVFLCYFGVLAYFAIPHLTAFRGQTDAGLSVLIGLAFLGLLPLSFLYPAISRFYYRGTALFRFALMILGRHPLQIFGCALLLAAGLLLALSNPVSLLFVPGIVCYLQSLLLEPVFRAHSSRDSSYDLWYGG